MEEAYEFTRRAVDWARGLGPWAPAGLAALCVLACLVPMPRSPLGLAAGALLGPWWGAALVSLSSAAGAALNLFVTRRLARGAVERFIASRPRLALLDGETGRADWRTVLLLRLTPIPFVLTNYALGLTKVSFGAFVLVTWLVQLPGTVLFAAAGAAAAAPSPAGLRWLYAAGLAALALLIWRAAGLFRRLLGPPPPGPRNGPAA